MVVTVVLGLLSVGSVKSPVVDVLTNYESHIVKLWLRLVVGLVGL